MDEHDSTFVNVTSNKNKKNKKRKKNKDKEDSNERGGQDLNVSKKHKKDFSSHNINFVHLFKEIPQRIPFIGKPRRSTLSVSLPVSLIENVQSDELRAYVIGNIARTLTIYGVNEVVLYNDLEDKNTRWMEYFSINLRYLETPQYLRKFLFPMDPTLKYAGLQNPVNAPHHLRSSEWLPYREGVVRLIRRDSSYTSLYADCGIFSSVRVLNKEDLEKIYGLEYLTDEDGDIYQRVTIRLDEPSLAKCRKNWKEGKAFDITESGTLSGYLVDPEEPLKVAGLYWGYVVRESNSFAECQSGCPFNESGEYDLRIGTSERGELYSPTTRLPKYNNAIIHFGPVLGLENVIDEPEKKFDKYYNFCNNQKSRTIRTEEALLIALSLVTFTNPL
ncbi:hypothetical protein MACK_000332 [Theileria orientalis]|uniref:RNA methyltransferase n=1 Tax=Theileria orientalis TaxID=68886 RepID=A0A976QU99_THEOR|nr:hypothetical protein MACK_000332 [Theileria orientalis]